MCVFRCCVCMSAHVFFEQKYTYPHSTCIHTYAYTYIHAYIHTFLPSFQFCCRYTATRPPEGGAICNRAVIDWIVYVISCHWKVVKHQWTALPLWLWNHLLHVGHLVAPCGWQISFCLIERHLCLFLSLSLLNCLMQFSHCTRLQVWCCLVNIPLTLPSCALLFIHPFIHPSIHPLLHTYIHTYTHT